MTLSTHLVQDTGSERFEQLYRIYTTSLVPREQKKREEIEALVARPDYRFLAIEEDGVGVAFAILQLSKSEPIALLEYMATDAHRRNQGLGAHTFREAVAFIDGRTMIVESDSERETDAEDLAIRIRRKNFYKRLGCRQIADLHYILPLPGEGDPPMMDLLVLDPEQRDALAAETVRAWLVAIYTEVYGQQASDARIDEILGERHAFAIILR